MKYAIVWMLALLLGIGLLLSGCGRDRIETVPVPVPQPCANKRPDPIVPLNQQYDAAAWAEQTPQQKAALVSAAALARVNYGEKLNAATANCPEIK